MVPQYTFKFFFFNFYLFPQGVVVEAGSHCGTQAKLELGILLSVITSAGITTHTPTVFSFKGGFVLYHLQISP